MATRLIPIAPETLTKQPQYAAQINTGISLTSGLVDAIIPALRVPFSKADSPNVSTSPVNNALARTVVTASSTYTEQYSFKESTSANWTFFVLLNLTQQGSFSCIADFCSSALTSNNRICTNAYTSNNLGFGESVYVSGGAIFNSTTLAPLNKTVLLTITVDQSVNLTTMYLDGVSVGSVATGNAAAVALSQIVLFKKAGASDVSPAGASVFLAGVYTRAISAQEVKKLAENPWQIFKSTRLYFYSAVAISGGTKRIQIPSPVRKTQPQYAAQVNTGNPLTRNLVLAYSSGMPFTDGVHSVLGSIIGNVTTTYGNTGQAIKVDANARIEFPSTSDLNIVGDITIISAISATSASADALVVSKNAGAGGAGDSYPFGFGTSSTGTGNFARSGAGGFRVFYGTVGVPVGVDSVIAVTHGSDMSVSPTFYINGVIDSGIPTSQYGGGGSGPAAANNLPVRIGNRGDLTTPFTGLIYSTFIFSRVLSASEIAAISANPWQLFKSPFK